MIYVSSSCSKLKIIREQVEELAQNGFKNIELTGGSIYYEGLIEDLILLQSRYNLNYLLHNYFPPPQKDFVVNLASMDSSIFKQSMKHLKKAIRLSQLLNLSKFSFHAGFFIDLSPHNIGKKVKLNTVYSRDLAIERFCEGFTMLKRDFKGIDIYIENNVYSASNKSRYNDVLPFMLLTKEDYNELQRKIDFKLLLDIAHLFVTSHTMGRNFSEECDSLIPLSNYIHISDNDGLSDTNFELNPLGDIFQYLSKVKLIEKTITLEIYEGIDATKRSYNLLNRLLSTSSKERTK